MTQRTTDRYARWCESLALSVLAIVASPDPVLAVDAFQESAGEAVIDAEHYDAKIPRNGKDWVLETSVIGYSGTGYLTALPNTGITYNTGYVTASPELVYNVHVTTVGTYYIWIRGHASTTSDDSVHAGLDGTGPASADRISGFTTIWSWRRTTLDSAPATIVITDPGFHTIHLWMREDGLRVDKILLRTNSSSTAPSGTGPAESPRVTLSDITPPSGSITINGGAAATNNATATLTLSATDNSGMVAQMKFSNDGTTYSTPEPYATPKTWTLASGDGTKTVSVKFADAAGNWSAAATDTITLDMTPPQLNITSPLDGAVITAP